MYAEPSSHRLGHHDHSSHQHRRKMAAQPLRRRIRRVQKTREPLHTVEEKVRLQKWYIAF